jgi:hypothetical protein
LVNVVGVGGYGWSIKQKSPCPRMDRAISLQIGYAATHSCFLVCVLKRGLNCLPTYHLVRVR